MSDRIASSKWRWGVPLLLAAGVTAVAAGGVVLIVWYMRNRDRRQVAVQPSGPAPVSEELPSPLLLPVEEAPVVAVQEYKLGSESRTPVYAYGHPQLREYSVHTLKSFPPESFQGSNYGDVYAEVLKWVNPVSSHPSLHTAFLEYTLPPKLHEKLHLLSETLLKMENMMASGNTLPENQHTTLDPILNELSTDPSVKMDQIKSLRLISEAFKEFPRHIVESCIKSLPQGKRHQLIDFIKSIPYGVDKKVFTEPDSMAIFIDADLQPIMKRIGFSKPSYTSDLTWEAEDDGEEDRLVAGLFLLAGSDCH